MDNKFYQHAKHSISTVETHLYMLSSRMPAITDHCKYYFSLMYPVYLFYCVSEDTLSAASVALVN